MRVSRLDKGYKDERCVFLIFFVFLDDVDGVDCRWVIGRE